MTRLRRSLLHLLTGIILALPFAVTSANLLNPSWGEAKGFVQHNRLIVFEDKRYQYDDYGRLIEKRIGRHTTVRLRWNKEHQLVESTTERNGVRQNSRYEYDALGRRTLRKDLFGETRFLWDGMRLLQEKRGDQNTTYLYQPGTHEPIARIDDTEPDYRPPGAQVRIYHFHTHINGAPEELTDETGQTLWRARYKTWGNLALEESFAPLPERSRAEHATKQPIRMQGQYADTETGLYYNTFRYYDPDVGRFISEDPIGLLGGLNLYQFAPNADAWVDPWGWCKSFNKKDNLTKKWVDKLSGKKPHEVDAFLRKKGYTPSVHRTSPGATPHARYTRTTKNGDVDILDHHPGGGVHGNDYWKIYRNGDTSGHVQGRIGHGEFVKYDKISEPLYVDGKLINPP